MKNYMLILILLLATTAVQVPKIRQIIATTKSAPYCPLMRSPQLPNHNSSLPVPQN